MTEIEHALEEERRINDVLVDRLREHAGDYRAHVLDIPMSHELVWDERHVTAWQAAELLTVRNAQVAAVLTLHQKVVPPEIQRPNRREVAYCAHCVDTEPYSSLWPCHTVRAIEEAEACT